MKSTVAAIEFGTSKIVVLIGEAQNDAQGVMQGYGVSQYSGFLSDGWNDSDEELASAVRTSIEAAQQMAKTSITQLYVGVPALHQRVICYEGQLSVASFGKKITYSDVDAVMSLALSEAKAEDEWVPIHQMPLWFKVDDNLTMEPIGKKAQTIACKVGACYARKSFCDDVTQKLSDLGIGVQGFLSPSLGQALYVIPSQERDNVAVLIDCGYLSTQVMVVQGDALGYLGYIDDGAGYMTAEIAQELSVSMAEAEKLKREVILAVDSDTAIEVSSGQDGQKLVDNTRVVDILLPRIDELAGRIQAHLAGCGIDLPANAAYYLTGGGLTPVRGAREYLASRLRKGLKAVSVRPSMLVGANYTSAVGLMELCYEQKNDEAAEIKNGIVTKLKAIFKK